MTHTLTNLWILVSLCTGNPAHRLKVKASVFLGKQIKLQYFSSTIDAKATVTTKGQRDFANSLFASMAYNSDLWPQTTLAILISLFLHPKGKQRLSTHPSSRNKLLNFQDVMCCVLCVTHGRATYIYIDFCWEKQNITPSAVREPLALHSPCARCIVGALILLCQAFRLESRAFRKDCPLWTFFGNSYSMDRSEMGKQMLSLLLFVRTSVESSGYLLGG